MKTAEDFMQGNVICEIDGCTEVATKAVKDFGHLFGQGPIATELVPLDPIHFLCESHNRDSYAFKRVDGQWVRF